MRELHVLALGAGKQSTTLYLLAVEGQLHFDAAVFADTQEEPQSVYEHLWWLNRMGGPPIIIDSAGKLGDDLRNGRNGTKRFASIPAYTRAPWESKASGVVPRQCTKEYKTEVIGKVIRQRLLRLEPKRSPRGVIIHQYFGISRDESRRAVKIQKHVQARKSYRAHFPLLELGWTRQDCDRFNQTRVPHEVPRSACVFCPYKSDREWGRLKRTDPTGWARGVEIDESLRQPDSVVNRQLNHQLFVHRSAQPLATVDFDDRSGWLGFAQECESGVCGV